MRPGRCSSPAYLGGRHSLGQQRAGPTGDPLPSCPCGHSPDRTGGLSLFRRTLVPTELSDHDRGRQSGRGPLRGDRSGGSSPSVGTARLELASSWSQTRRAGHLRYVPERRQGYTAVAPWSPARFCRPAVFAPACYGYAATASPAIPDRTGVSPCEGGSAILPSTWSRVPDVGLTGFEPMTPSPPVRCAEPNCATARAVHRATR